MSKTVHVEESMDEKFESNDAFEHGYYDYQYANFLMLPFLTKTDNVDETVTTLKLAHKFLSQKYTQVAWPSTWQPPAMYPQGMKIFKQMSEIIPLDNVIPHIVTAKLPNNVFSEVYEGDVDTCTYSININNARAWKDFHVVGCHYKSNDTDSIDRIVFNLNFGIEYFEWINGFNRLDFFLPLNKIQSIEIPKNASFELFVALVHSN